MTREEFDEALAAHGADFTRWPGALAGPAAALAAADPVARDRLAEARRLDALLAAVATPAPVGSATLGRILAGIAGDRERQAAGAAVRPTPRLFAWAGAAMAMFLVVGFVLGVALPGAAGDDEGLATLLFGSEFTATGDGGFL